MTPEEQGVAIAKACGWKRDELHSALSWYKGETWRTRTAAINVLPDYLHDLNAMNEAEKARITNNEVAYFVFEKQLRKLVDTQGTGVFLHHATAAQRAEAFLKCLGLWK